MAKATIYHNPRCSKSRQTLALLRSHGIEPEIVEYLKSPPSPAGLKLLLKALGKQPNDIMRKKEADFKGSGLNVDGLTEEQQLEKMVAFPKVIERPIVVVGDKAVIGRPPENILTLIE